jgi:hypothetical protein
MPDTRKFGMMSSSADPVVDYKVSVRDTDGYAVAGKNNNAAAWSQCRSQRN